MHLLGFHYGRPDMVRMLCRKSIAAYLEMGIAKSLNYADEKFEVSHLLYNATFVLLNFGEGAAAAKLIESVGFAWDDIAFEAYWPSLDSTIGPCGTMPKTTWHVLLRLQLWVISPEGTISPADVLDFMPSPTELAELDKSWFTYAGMGLSNITAWGARAYERLGDDERAAETAQLGIQWARKKARYSSLPSFIPRAIAIVTTTRSRVFSQVVIADCHRTLGRIAVRRGDTDTATTHFLSAVENALCARVHALVVIIARELKRRVPSARGDGDRLIDEACARMGKERATFEALLPEEE